MKSIHIRDVDPEVLRRLQRLAKLHHRSMQGELKAILEDASKRAPELEPEDPLDVVTVDAGSTGRFDRDDLYADER
ncbi:MAG: Arc family DNA-binding protein [Spirochaetes bacterium]|jgi:plasmid stability protein|nr:Arc family DNA-binding protein [Spirochaetota bacterium]